MTLVGQYMGNTMMVSSYWLALELTSFQGAVNPTQKQASKSGFRFSLADWFQSYRLAAQAAGDKYLCAFPFDFAMLVDFPAIHA